MFANARLAAAVQGLLGEVFVFVFSSFSFLTLALNHLACMAWLQACYAQLFSF